MTTETTVSDLKINKLTSAQYATITPSATELYFITDDSGITSSDIVTALGYTPTKTITAQNGSLTQSGGVCTWTITNPFGKNANIDVYNVSTGEKEMPNTITLTSSTAVITFLSTSNISANTYTATLTGVN